MKCSKCSIELKCPCEACRPKNWKDPGLYILRSPEDYLKDFEQCPLCRFYEHIDWWESREWDLVRPQLVEQGILEDRKD